RGGRPCPPKTAKSYTGATTEGRPYMLSQAAIILVILLGIGLPILRAQSLPVRFTDITKQAGITFRHVASPEKKYLVESMSGGVAMFDYDNDGWMDIYFVNSLSVDLAKSGGKSKSILYHNNGDGTFTDVTDKAGIGD